MLYNAFISQLFFNVLLKTLYKITMSRQDGNRCQEIKIIDHMNTDTIMLLQTLTLSHIILFFRIVLIVFSKPSKEEIILHLKDKFYINELITI